MSIHETFGAYDRPITSPALDSLRRLAGFWWAQFLARLDARRTHRILSSLDPEVLEDIGVPHTNVRPSAGLLERHPHVIAITMWTI